MENRYDFDVLGSQILLAYQFFKSSFKGEEIVIDTIEDQQVELRSVFTEKDGRWFMKNESVPGDISIKAIALDKDNLYVETSLLDLNAVRQVIADEMLPFKHSVAKHGFIDTSSQKKLISVASANAKQTLMLNGMDQRCLWTIPWHKDEKRILACIYLADCIFSANAFRENPGVSINTNVRRPGDVQKLEMKLNLELQQKMLIEQRPVLSLNISQKTEMQARTELQLQVLPMLALEARIGKMTEAEVIEYFTKDLTADGQKRATSVIAFIMARKIKNSLAIQGKIVTWKAARRIARQLIFHN